MKHILLGIWVMVGLNLGPLNLVQAQMFDPFQTITKDTFDAKDRYVTKCGTPNDIFTSVHNGQNYAEVCNEPDEVTFGVGATVEERATNYYQSLKTAHAQYGSTHKMVLGGLSGYNYQFLKHFLSHPNACQYFDVFNYHPYHYGVPPDEINTSKNAWHTVEQWTNFIAEILTAYGCGPKELWITELGYSLQGKNSELPVTEKQQLSFLTRQEVILLSLGARLVDSTYDPLFALSPTNREKSKRLKHLLVGSKFVSYKQFGNRYCPRGGSCFYTADQYRGDSGKTIYGLRGGPTNQGTGQMYTFSKRGVPIVFAWYRGQEEVYISYGSYRFTLSSDLNHLRAFMTDAANPERTRAFSDVASSGFLNQALVKLKRKNMISGYPDGTFKEDNAISRAEFTKLIVLMDKTFSAGQYRNSVVPFTDVKSGDWFHPYVAHAHKRGIIEGYSDNTFRPGATVNAAEALKIFVGTNNLPRFTAHTYSDIPPGAWYEHDVGIAQKLTLMPTRSPLSLGPGKNLTRAEAALMIHQYENSKRY